MEDQNNDFNYENQYSEFASSKRESFSILNEKQTNDEAFSYAESSVNS